MTHLPDTVPSPFLPDNCLAINPAALTLLREISLTVGQAEDFQAALRRLVRLVCDSTEWVFGEVWLPAAGSRLCHSGVWFAAQPQHENFGQASLTWQFAPGEGLPGRVYQTATVEWIADVAQTSGSTFQRRDIALQCGLGAAVGVPVTLNETILMVLVFFMDQAHPRDRLQIHLIEAIAAQLGAILHLKQTEAALITHQQQVQRLLNTLPGIVFTATGPPEWKMRSLSDGCTRLTGYNHEELITDNSHFTYNDITHPDDLARVLTTIQAALAPGQFYEVEYRLITRSGFGKKARASLTSRVRPSAWKASLPTLRPSSKPNRLSAKVKRDIACWPIARSI